MSKYKRPYTGVYEIPIVGGRIKVPNSLNVSAIQRSGKALFPLFYAVPDGLGGQKCLLYDEPTFQTTELTNILYEPISLVDSIMMLPFSLRKYLEIEDRLVLLGASDNFEIWNPESFREERKLLNSIDLNSILLSNPRLKLT